MNARSTLIPTLAAAALILVAPAAQAAPPSVDRFDRSAFDSAGVVTGSGYSMAGATSGELGGHLTLAVQAADGTIPAQGQCETADVQAVLTVAPGESFAIDTTGELCSHFIDGTPTLNAYFGAKQVELRRHPQAGSRQRRDDRLHQELPRRPGLGRPVGPLVSTHGRVVGPSAHHAPAW